MNIGKNGDANRFESFNMWAAFRDVGFQNEFCRLFFQNDLRPAVPFNNIALPGNLINVNQPLLA